MKSCARAVLVSLSLWAAASLAGEPVPTTAPVHQDETRDLVGTLEVRTPNGKEPVRVLHERGTGKRLVLPSLPKQLPAGFVWGTFTGEVAVKAVVMNRERDGKTQLVVKRILAITDPPAAAESTPAAATANP